MIAALLLTFLHAALGSSLEGAVRSSDGSSPVVGALVEIRDSISTGIAERALTDVNGRYVLPDLASGTYHLRVSRIGYDPRELDVLVISAPRIVVDVMLAPHPQLLGELHVHAALDSAWRALHAPSADPNEMASVSGDALHADPALESPDALQSLAMHGLATARDEAPTSLHVHGGAASENAMYVDGVPVFNAYHANGTLTAIDPDVIAGASLDRGAPSAMFGNATAGIIAVTTAGSDTGRVVSRGGFSARAIRESLGGSLPLSGGTFLIGFRRSLNASLSDSHGAAIDGTGFGDLFAKVTFPLASGELEMFALHGTDRLSFNGVVDHAPFGHVHDDVRRDESAADVQPLPTETNSLGWNSGTDAVTWRSGGAERWRVSAWRTQFGADFGWTGTTRLTSALTTTGAAASAAWRWGGVHLSSGVNASEYNVVYDVGDLVADNPVLNGQTPLALSAHAPIVSSFADAQWNMGSRWSADAGVRAALESPVRTGAEPRLSLHFAPVPAVALGIGYARTHQYVQSLRNEESLFDAVAGISFPALAGSRFGTLDVPASQSDQLIATADVHLSTSLTFSATAYTRRETGAVLVAPVTAQPFALTGFAVGSERAQGMSLSLTREGQRISGELGYSLGGVRDRGDGVSYSPSYDAAQVISSALGVRVAPGTIVRLAAFAHSGAPTSVVGDQIEWMPYTSSQGHGDLAGSPQHIVGTLDGARLPAYVRMDLGIRHDWHLRAFGRAGALRTSAGVTNLFGRVNALGMMAPAAAGTPNLILMPRRSASFGLEWTY